MSLTTEMIRGCVKACVTDSSYLGKFYHLYTSLLEEVESSITDSTKKDMVDLLDFLDPDVDHSTWSKVEILYAYCQVI